MLFRTLPYPFKLFLVFIVIGIAFPGNGYNTIYLMEFDNLKNDFTNSHLREALPDLIKENYKIREDINIEYAGDIRPYFDQKYVGDDQQIKGLIINGRFKTVNEDFYVEFEAYDIHSWKQLVKRQLYCPVHDIICLHDAFLIAIEQSISPFLVDDLNLDATIQSLENSGRKRKIDLDEEAKKELSESGELSGAAADPGVQKKNTQGQYGSRHYREFNLDDLAVYKTAVGRENTRRLLELLDQVLVNPYDVQIGELQIQPDPSDSRRIIGEIPVEFSIRSTLAQDLLSNLPHQKKTNDNGNIMLQFSNNEFLFDDPLIDKLALMKYQVMPVVIFTNRIGTVQFFLLDSWNEKYMQLKPKNIPILHQSHFRPLFALTPGIDHIQMDLDVNGQTIYYSFSIPREIIGGYTKVTVKFMQENELDQLLANQITGG